MKTALTIAGSDSSGGAGIQADIKTMAANGVYAMSAITALTAQNTTGVSDIMEVTPKFLGEQIDSVFTDIRPDAAKIGMVASAQLISKIAEKLKEYDAKNVVVDPVMVATSGAKLISDDAIETLKTELMPLADLLTPNIPEAEVLADMKIGSEAEMEAAAGIISRKYGCAVLCKGGHKVSDASDLLCTDSQRIWFRGERIDNPNTHGTGCTLSSAIPWRTPLSAPRRISQELCPPGSIWDRAAGRWIIHLISKVLLRKRLLNKEMQICGFEDPIWGSLGS